MSDSEKQKFYELARLQAEQDYKKNNKDTQALTRWGGALLELANFVSGEEAPALVDDAVDKFHKALAIDPRKHEALWCLGNAYTSKGFLCHSKSVAAGFFTKAQQCFRDASAEQPDNPIYKKGIEMTAKAPDLYDEIQKQINPPAAKGPGGSFWFDCLGYVTVFAALLSISAIVGMLNPKAAGAASAGSK